MKYSWIQQTTSTDKNALATDPLVGLGVWMLNNWFQQNTSLGQALSVSYISSKWQLAMDLIDVELKRPIYQSCQMSITPYFGLMAAFIWQKLNLEVDVAPYVINNLTTSPIYSHNSSSSWALGPRTGLDLYWILPVGFKLQGGLAATLFFTQYTDVKHSEQVASASSMPSTLKTKLPIENCVRPELEGSFGFSWGTYFRNDKYYMNVTAVYDFILFWQQNMMRKLMDQTISGSSGAAGNLYLQGVNLGFSLYF